MVGEKMKNRKILIIFLIILIVIGFAVIGVNLYSKDSTPSKEQKKPEKKEPPVVELQEELDDNQKKAQDMSKQFNQYLVDSTKTANDYYELTGIEPKYFAPMVGSDSSQEQPFIEELRAQISEDFSEYDKALEKYSSSLSSTIKKHYTFKLKGNPLYTEDKKQLLQIVEIKPFSYVMYKNDLQEVTNKILSLAKIKVEGEDAKTMLSVYKARVKAMEILDSQLSAYKNKKTQEANLIYDIGDKVKCNNCHFYINDVQGFYLDEVKIVDKISNYEKNKKVRINKIIDDAVSNKILNKNNPLKLK